MKNYTHLKFSNFFPLKYWQNDTLAKNTPAFYKVNKNGDKMPKAITNSLRKKKNEISKS